MFGMGYIENVIIEHSCIWLSGNIFSLHQWLMKSQPGSSQKAPYFLHFLSCQWRKWTIKCLIRWPRQGTAIFSLCHLAFGCVTGPLGRREFRQSLMKWFCPVAELGGGGRQVPCFSRSSCWTVYSLPWESGEGLGRPRHISQKVAAVQRSLLGASRSEGAKPSGAAEIWFCVTFWLGGTLCDKSTLLWETLNSGNLAPEPSLTVCSSSLCWTGTRHPLHTPTVTVEVASRDLCRGPVLSACWLSHPILHAGDSGVKPSQGSCLCGSTFGHGETCVRQSH